MKKLNPAKIEVRFADCDMMGHVNNAVYLSYFEQARMQYFSQIVGENWNWQKEGMILVKNEVEYLFPIFLNDKPEIIVKLVEIGTKSFTLAYHVFVKEKQVAKGFSKLVCFDFTINKSVEVFPKLKTALELMK